jgi:hypothetical protein
MERKTKSPIVVAFDEYKWHYKIEIENDNAKRPKIVQLKPQGALPSILM